MTNLLTHFISRIVRHDSHHAERIYAGMVQWLYLKKLLLLSQMLWGQFPAMSIIFAVLGEILFYLLIHDSRKLKLMVRAGDIFLPAW